MTCNALRSVPFIAGLATASLAQPTIIDLGASPIDGGLYRPFSVNADGSVVAGARLYPVAGSDTVHTWMRWTPTGGVEELGVPATYESGTSLAVSGNGEVLAGFAYDSVSVRFVPFVWTQTDGFAPVPLPAGFGNSFANYLNADGTVILGRTQTGTDFPLIVWGLGPAFTLPITRSNFTDPAGLSDDGLVIVGSDASLSPFRWIVGTGREPLGDSPQPSCFGSAARATNADASVIFGGCSTFIGTNSLPWRWSRHTDTNLLPLGDSVGGRIDSCTGDGRIAVGAATFPGNFELAIWIADLPPQRLSDYLTSAGLDLTGWNFGVEDTRRPLIADISADGSTIVGHANRAGQLRGFIIRNLPAIPCPTIITTQPVPTLSPTDGLASLTVATDPVAGALSYQWFFNASPIFDGPQIDSTIASGTKTATLTLTNLAPSASGLYSCRVTSLCGIENSKAVPLAVVRPGCGEAVEEISVGSSCSAGQVCDSVPFVTRETSATLRAEYVTSPSHCSSVGMIYFLDLLGAVATAPAQPAATSTGLLDLGPVAPGQHDIGLQAFGVEGGCNSGFLANWGGTLRLTTSIAAPNIISSPLDATTCNAGATFTTLQTPGSPALVYWEVSNPDNPADWIVIGEGDNFIRPGVLAFSATGVGTTSLTILPGPDISLWPSRTLQVRCVLANYCDTVTSNAASLRVSDPADPTCCPCAADFDGSGGTPDVTDIDAFFQSWLLGDPTADADCSGGTPDSTDIEAFFTQWLAGGC
jgi:uncharacterized membrane protein